MNLQKYIFLLALVAAIFSCRKEKASSTHQNPSGNAVENKATVHASARLPITEIITKLQGEWKEPDYPFRRLEVKGQTVKFTEEGIAEKPKFTAFELSNSCPFEVNNIKSIEADEIIFSIAENKRCEKLKIKGDTLKLRGYSTHTKEDYEIIYKKVK